MAKKSDTVVEEVKEMVVARDLQIVVRSLAVGRVAPAGAMPAHQVQSYIASYLDMGYELINVTYMGMVSDQPTFAYHLLK